MEPRRRASAWAAMGREYREAVKCCGDHSPPSNVLICQRDIYHARPMSVIANWINFCFMHESRPAMVLIYDEMSLNATPAYLVLFSVEVFLCQVPSICLQVRGSLYCYTVKIPL